MDDTHNLNPGKTLWPDAARDGGIIGALLFTTMLLNELMRANLSEIWQERVTALVGIINFFILAGCLFVFTRRRSVVYGNSGFSFAQAMGYIVTMMIFTGFITGMADFLAMNVISPDYYALKLDEAMKSNPLLEIRPDLWEDSARMMRAWLKSPLYFLLLGILGKVIYGGIIGLFVSAVAQRPPVKA